MKHDRLTKILVLMLLLHWCLPALAAGNNTLLWQIGKADNDTTEFALGPDRSNQYSTTFPHDALFVAGQSDPKKDWPYIQPGPVEPVTRFLDALYGNELTALCRPEELVRLGDTEYPYDMIQLRYSIGGDNGPPEPDMSDFVKDWNQRYWIVEADCSESRPIYKRVVPPAGQT